jgi:hypothetical protein
MFARLRAPISLGMLICLSLSGCAGDGVFARRDNPCVGDDCIGPQFVQFERGQPNIVVDAVGWVFGIPNRILLWNWDVQNHDISPATEQQLREYVAVNGLQDVKVRLNQYDPGGEWQRLARNDRVGAGWRYTVGAWGTLGYTIFPGRLFSIDYYNPFTNTVNVYSDVPALGMKEVAYAADVVDRDLPGTYAFSQLIPGVNLVHETITTREVLGYVDAAGDANLRRETVHVLYPSYGGAFGGAVDSFLPTSPVFQLGGILVGHVSGRMETRGWDRTDQQMLGSHSLEAEHEDIRVTPPQQFFASDTALPIGLSRTTRRNEAANANDVSLPFAPAAPSVAQTAAGSAPQAEPTDIADNTEPEVGPDPSAGEIVNVGFEEPAAPPMPTPAEE